MMGRGKCISPASRIAMLGIYLWLKFSGARDLHPRKLTSQWNTIWRCISYQKSWFSIAVLVFGGVRLCSASTLRNFLLRNSSWIASSWFQSWTTNDNLQSPVPISMCTVTTVLKSLNLVHLGIWEVLHMKTRGEEVAERDKVLVVWQLYGSVKVPVAAPYILSPAKFSLSAT